MGKAAKRKDKPAKWADAFRQGAVFLAFAIPFVGLVGMIAGAWSVAGEWGSAADWIQAIGSIIAIVAAGYFPIRHLELAGEKRQQSLLELMRVQADQGAEAIWLLTNCFVHPEHELAQMREYLQNHRASDFDPLVAGLGQVPIAEIPPQRVNELGQIRNAVQFGASVAAQLPAWIAEGSSNPGTLVSLRAKRDLLVLIRGRLPVPAGMVDGKVDAQLRGESHECFSEPLTIRNFKVYRRYFWYHIPKGQFARRVQVQILPPFGDSHPITFETGSPSAEGWADIYHAESDVRKVANKCIDDFIDREHGIT